MIVENHALWGEEPTEEYPATFTYLGAEPLPDKPNGRRPAVIICGGGAFTHIAPHEQDPVAFAFLDHGYQAFVLNYVTSGTGDVSFPHPQADLAKMVATVRANADEWHVDPKRVCVVGFSAGGIHAGEFLMHYDEYVTGTALDSTYVPDELDTVLAYASAAGMIYSFYGRLSVGNMNASWLTEGDLPPTFYVYGTEDPFYRQFQQQYDVISGMGISTGRIVLNGWPHGFGSDGGWVKDYAAWLETIFA